MARQGDFVFEDVASFVNDLKLTLKSLDCDHDDDDVDNDYKTDHDTDDEDGTSFNNIRVFDLCPKRVSYVMMNPENRYQSNIKILQPGMVLMKGYISLDDQVSIVKTCRDLGIGAGGFYKPGYKTGRKLHLQMMCLGKNWDLDTNTYTELRRSDKSKPPGIPEKFHDMVKKAIQDSNDYVRNNKGEVVPSMSPDICLVNFYSESGCVGLHQDKTESEKSLKEGLPVVSFSIGDSADFLYGETRDVDEASKVILESGDVLIFGGKSRLIYHSVPSIHPDTAPTALIEATDMRSGRLNLTFRMY